MFFNRNKEISKSELLSKFNLVKLLIKQMFNFFCDPAHKFYQLFVLLCLKTWYMSPKILKGVPAQKSGGFHDTESRKVFDQDLIPEKFEILKKRFFSINQWESYSGKAFAAFKLYNLYGNPVDREPLKGDFIRIDIPGPGETEAKGYDWVEITDICFYEDSFSESISITCRPSVDPQNEKSLHIAHFYSSAATSTFMITRNIEYLKAAVYGRNEKPNRNAKFLDVLRNFAIAIGGMIGIAKIQWKQLTDSFLDFD